MCFKVSVIFKNIQIVLKNTVDDGTSPVIIEA